ncbi:MAG: DUF3789 domain-containing protein [Ammonifex sp.]|nr:MAG: DUF3789 domain-containing protein [Ammonifex sp.]
MTFVLGFVVGALVGSFAGLLVFCMCVAAKKGG